ncbi:MAG: radical SAM protein, partial [Deltaproteobacteria bacterium]
MIGEAEEMLGEFLDRALGGALGREAILERSEEVVGAYRPGRHTPLYDERGDLAGVRYDGPGNGRVRRRFVEDLDAFATNSEVLAPEAVFGDMYLVETSRGCEWGCRFCAAGFMYRPVRYRSLRTLRESVARGLQQRRTIGLVGAEMASLPGVSALCQEVAGAGGRASPSSLKADVITPALAAALGRNGNRSVTVAPEAGSERMRRVINKNLTEPEILRARRRRCRHRRADREGSGTRAERRPGACGPHPRVHQPVRSEALDALPVGADGSDPLAQDEARRARTRARRHAGRR